MMGNSRIPQNRESHMNISNPNSLRIDCDVSAHAPPATCCFAEAPHSAPALKPESGGAGKRFRHARL